MPDSLTVAVAPKVVASRNAREAHTAGYFDGIARVYLGNRLYPITGDGVQSWYRDWYDAGYDKGTLARAAIVTV